VHRLPTRPAAEDSRNLKTQLGAVVASMLTIIVLVGRATTVPSTAVLAGLQRTTTETATASSTCDGRERQVANLPDLALGAGGRFVQATIGVAAWLTLRAIQ
jgi:hypothetical protein